jgi:hypothetical protein
MNSWRFAATHPASKYVRRAMILATSALLENDQNRKQSKDEGIAEIEA